MTEPTRILFICSRNQWRSPTAERLFSRRPGLSVRSAGTSKNARRTVNEADIRWADMIIVMEPKHRDRLKSSFPRSMLHKTLYVLDIPDDYPFMDPDLITALEQAIPPLIKPSTN